MRVSIFSQTHRYQKREEGVERECVRGWIFVWKVAHVVVGRVSRNSLLSRLRFPLLLSLFFPLPIHNPPPVLKMVDWTSAAELDKESSEYTMDR